VIGENLRRARRVSAGTIRRQDVRRTIRQDPGQFDLVILDPPYAVPPTELDGVISEIAGQGVVSAGGRVVLTRPAKGYTPVIPLDWLLVKRLSYGEAVIAVFQIP